MKDGGGFNDYSLMNLLHDPLPALHYYTVDFYAADYDSEEILEECLQSGGEFYGELSEEDCECLAWDDFYDVEKDEYRECTDEEKDEGKCDCDQIEEKYVDQYYYEQLQAEYLSTVDLEGEFYNIDELTDETDTVELMSQYYDTTEYMVESEFEYDEGGMVTDWHEHDADTEYHLELLNDALYPDVDMLGDSTSVEVITEEQQLDLFHGAWPFDSVMEDEDKEWIMKDYPENAVKYLYKKWDQDGVSWEDMKLLGMQAVQGDGVTMLLKRYIMNTQAPIPVTSLWDCDDLVQLFNDDNHEELIQRYLCGGDPWDWDGWYHHNEFYEGMLDSLDDGSWKMIMRILGIKDKEMAGRLLEGHVDNDEEDDIAAEKATEIEEIRDKITHAYSIEQEDATKRAIFEDIDDKIADWFDGTGRMVRDNNNGSYSWVIDSDLRNWISEDDWDNTDYFQHHPEYADRPLEDVMRDMARLTPWTLFAEIMAEEFGPGDGYTDSKRGDLLEVDRKYFDGYWYPDISEEYFNDILYEDLYELVPQSNDPESGAEVTSPEPLNEHARISDDIIEKLQGKEVRITLDENNSFLISRLRGTPFGERPFAEELIFTIDDIRQIDGRANQKGDYILTYDLLFKGAEPEGGRIDEFIKEYNLYGDNDRHALMKTFMQDRQPIQDQMYENVFKLFGIDDPNLDLAYIPRPSDTPPREFFRDPSGLRESVSNFKELYNASPRPLQQILMDQWKAKQNPEWHPEGNVLKHIITVTNRAFATQPENINLILSAYFHDLGKLATAGVNPKTGQPTAHGHEKVSTQLVNEYSEFIESLGGDPEEIEYMVSNHMKMKPRVWDVMRQSKKDKITDHPSFDNLDAFSKIDRGGLQLDEEKMEFGKDKGLYDDDQYYDFTPFTNIEVKLLNVLSQEFTSEELEMMGDTDGASLPRALGERYKDIMKLFSIPASTMEDWVIASKYARWALDNWGEAADEVDEKRDYAQVKTPVKIYPSYFEVEAEESGWEKIFKHGSVEMPGFSSQDVTDRATSDWYDWGGEMETYDYGDWESDGWEIESTKHLETIKEHKKGEINPKLKKGDIIRIVDIDGEHVHMPRRYNLYKVMEFSTANNHPDHWHYTLHALDHYDLDTLGKPRDRYLYPGDLWVHHRESLNEHQEIQLSPELEVGDSIRVIDVDRERENGETMYTTPPDELRPEILTPYIVVEKESAGHKAKWPWRYTLLPADKYQDYLNGDYMVGRGTAKLLYPWIYQWIKVHKKPITEQKEILNPSLNIGDIIRVVDVDKDTRYKQSAGSGMYRTLSRGELHGDDTIPTIMDTYYVTSPEPVNASQITFGGEKITHPNPYWNLLTVGKGNNPKEPDEFQLTTDDFDRGNRIITTNDKWIMVKKHVSNIPQEIEARQKEIDASGRNITSTRLTEGENQTNSLIKFLDDNWKEEVLGTYRHYALLNRLDPVLNNRADQTEQSEGLTQAIADLMELWTSLNGDLYKLGLIPLPRPDHHGPNYLLGLNDHPVVREWVYNIINTVDEMDVVDIRDDDGNFIRYALREVTTPLRILKEQEIDTTKIPKEEISPPLKVGDKIFVWDLEMDPAPPGGGTTMLTMPNTTVGTVVHVYEGNASEEPRGDIFRGGIKYEIDTYDGHFGLYQGVEDYDYYADDGGGRDKWIILKNTPLTEAIIPQLPEEERPNIPNYIRRLLIIGRFEYKGGWGKNPQTFLLYLTPTGKIMDIAKSGTVRELPFQIGDTVNIFDLRDFEKSSDYTLTMGGKLRGEMAEQVNRPLQAVQKDFIIKRKFFESFDKMDLTQFLQEQSRDITTQQLGEKRKVIFEFLHEVKKKELTNENFYSHFLVGGKEWITAYSTVLKKDSGLLSEEGDTIRKLVWETTIQSLKNKNKEVSLRDTQRDLLPTATRLVNLWKETL